MTKIPLTLLLAAVVFVGGIAFHLGAQQDTAAGGPARYVLVPSEFQTTVNNTRLSERSLFKVDSATGRTWRLVSTVDKGVLQSYWDAIDEPATRR
jgi:hypothetical protein